MKTLRRFLISLMILPALPGSAQETETSYEAYEYAGINAEPPVTLQIFPSENGDTVVNDALDPPGEGNFVVVGYWEYKVKPLPEDEIPCSGEPVMKIAYPVDYGSTSCYAWKHWVLDDVDQAGYPVPHDNSAKNFSCSADGSFTLEQWTDSSCGRDGTSQAQGVVKHAWTDRCVLDTEFDPDRASDPDPNQEYQAVYSKLLAGCGKEPPRRRADVACDENTPLDPEAPYSATLSFWKSSEIEDPSRIPDQEPYHQLEFTWTEPQECFSWLRTVAGSDELRLNVANAFSLRFEGEQVKFAYGQNGWVCCEEFTRAAVIKEFFNDRLVLDETTGQQGDPLYVGLTDYRAPVDP